MIYSDTARRAYTCQTCHTMPVPTVRVVTAEGKTIRECPQCAERRRLEAEGE